MPDYLPYPAANYILNTTEYDNGDLNITAKTIDVAGNINHFSITVDINNTETDNIWK